MLWIWAINGTPNIKLQLVKTNILGYTSCTNLLSLCGTRPWSGLKMWETKAREHWKLLKVHQVRPQPSQWTAEGSSFKSLALNAVTGQCRCNLYVNTSVLQKHYNSLLQLPWARLLTSIKRFLQRCMQIAWPHKITQGIYLPNVKWLSLVWDIHVLYYVYVL